MRLGLAALALAAGPGLAAPGRVPVREGGLDAGWWIVVGSGPEPGEGPSIAPDVRAAAARCGFSVFNDFSAKFSGFAAGYEVFVVGAYRSKPEASRRLAAVRRCVPSAYLKFGTYAGE